MRPLHAIRAVLTSESYGQAECILYIKLVPRKPPEATITPHLSSQLLLVFLLVPHSHKQDTLLIHELPLPPHRSSSHAADTPCYQACADSSVGEWGEALLAYDMAAPFNHPFRLSVVFVSLGKMGAVQNPCPAFMFSFYIHGFAVNASLGWLSCTCERVS